MGCIGANNACQFNSREYHTVPDIELIICLFQYIYISVRTYANTRSKQWERMAQTQHNVARLDGKVRACTRHCTHGRYVRYFREGIACKAPAARRHVRKNLFDLLAFGVWYRSCAGYVVCMSLSNFHGGTFCADMRQRISYFLKYSPLYLTANKIDNKIKPTSICLNT